MTSRVQRAAFAALLLACATPASAQMTPIFRMNCGTTGANYPLCGWSVAVGDNSRGVYWNRSWVNGAGPSGEGVVQFDHVATSNVVEYYAGWAQYGLPQVSQGSTRYIRFKIKFRGPTNLPAAQTDKAGWGGKFVILGDGADWSPAPERTRFISNIRENLGDRANWMFRTEMNVDSHRIDYRPVTQDVWHSIQIKIRSSTSTSSGDGRLSFYVDGSNASENTPTVQSVLGQINTDGWHATLGFGYYFLTLGPGGRSSYQVTGFEYDDQFDPNWHTGGGGGGGTPTAPTAPSNVRILSASASLLGWGGVAALVTSIRRRRRRQAGPVDQVN